MSRRGPSLPANSPQLFKIPQQDQNSPLPGSEKLRPSPPSNNMGALVTTAPEKPNENQCLIDWIAWTFKDENPGNAIESAGLSCLDFSQCDYGGMGYRKSLRAGNVVIFYDGTPGMGCHVSMTGQGCRMYEAASKVSNCWYRLLLRVSAAGGTFTRIDLALDNIDGSLDLARLKECIDRLEVRTRFKGGQEINKFSFLQNPTKQGKTVYLGSPASRIKIRFYDKAAQLGIDGDWVRCELQLMAERACEVVKYITTGKDVGLISVAVLNNYFAVINLDDSNKSRCTLQDWWANWLITTGKLKLTTMKAIRLVGHVIQHIKNQYAPSFSMIRQCLGIADFKAFIDEILLLGNDRMTKKHKLIIENSIQLECLPF
jgi:phage replication initiation protein